MKMNKLNKVAKVLAKICEVSCWIIEVLIIILFIILVSMKDIALEFIQSGLDNGDLTIATTNFNIMDGNGELSVSAIVVALVCGMIAFVLISMMFRNVYLIFKRCEIESPFTNDNVKRVCKIGIYAIAIPIIEIIVSLVGLFIGCDGGVVVNTFAIVFGILMLCLSQIFAYGAGLEREVDGLV